MRVDPECIFCRIVRGEIPSTKVYEDDQVVAFRDIQPAAPVHVLVVAREHVASLHALAAEDADLVSAIILAAQAVADQEGISADGYRVVTNIGTHGGQTVNHLHFHVLGGRQLRALG